MIHVNSDCGQICKLSHGRFGASGALERFQGGGAANVEFEGGRNSSVKL